MFFQRDGTGPRKASQLPEARFSLRTGDGYSILHLFCNALSRHPFNQQVFIVASDGQRGPVTQNTTFFLKSVLAEVAKKSCCFCMRNVSLDAFLHLPLQQLVLERWKGSVLTWRGPGGSVPCCGAPTADAAKASCPVIGDTGGDMNVASLHSNGVMILKLDRLTAQVLGLDTWIRLPHFMRKSLPPGTRYLKIDVRHPAVVRHQKAANENRQKQHMQGVQREQGNSIGRPPSRLYEQLQRSLSSLEPVDLLCSTSPPEGLQDGEQIDVVVGMAKEVQLTLRASGSPNATCNVVQLQCRLSEYRGGIMDMTEEAALAANKASSSYTQQEDILMTPELPASQTLDRLVLPDWQKLSLAVASVGLRRRSPSPGEGVATLVVRQRGHQNAFKCRALSMSSQTRAQKSDSNAASRSLSCNELGNSVSSSRQCPPVHPDYLQALQLLHERQRQRRAGKSQQRNKDTQATPENGSHTEEALQLAAPPPFRALPPGEALFSQIMEYLGCLGMNMPVSREGCEWLREADPTGDPHSIGVASVSGGLIHSEAVQSVAESLYRWVYEGDSRVWAAISVVGVAEAAAVYAEHPHGSDISGESTLHLILYSCGQHHTSGILLQTIDACDATTSMP